MEKEQRKTEEKRDYFFKGFLNLNAVIHIKKQTTI